MDKYHIRKTERDDEYIEAYLSCHSQVKAAQICGVGRTAIVHALERANIPRDGRKHNGGYESQKKITDDELIKCAETMSCSEIAHRYNMTPERVYRRGKKLGITINDNLTGGHWKRRADFYGCKDFDHSITLKDLIARFDGVCQLCGLPIDESDMKDGHCQGNYPSLDHIKPLSKGGTHTWDNVQLAHVKCNAGKQDRLWQR